MRQAWAGGGDYYEPQQQIQEAVIEYQPQTASIEIKSDNPNANQVLLNIPDWLLFTSLFIGLSFILAGIIRFTPLGKYIKLFLKTWKNIAFGRGEGGRSKD